MDSLNQQTDSAATKISTEVLKMNFMKRTTVRIERQKRINERQLVTEQISAGKLEVLPPRHYPTVEHIDDDPNITLGGVMTEWRYTVLMDNLRFGRFSFKGQNPEVEKWMLFHERRRLGMADEEEEDAQNQQEGDDDEGAAMEKSGREEGEVSDDDDEGAIGIPKFVEKCRHEGSKAPSRRRRMSRPVGGRNDEKKRRKKR